MYFCVVLRIVRFVTYSVLFVCICVLYYCHRVATQLQLNISYHIKCEFKTCKSEPASIVLTTDVMYIERNIEPRSPRRSSHGKARVLYILSVCL